eukprot:2998922-Rhodomonas_salina.2
MNLKRWKMPREQRERFAVPRRCKRTCGSWQRNLRFRFDHVISCPRPRLDLPTRYTADTSDSTVWQPLSRCLFLGIFRRNYLTERDDPNTYLGYRTDGSSPTKIVRKWSLAYLGSSYALNTTAFAIALGFLIALGNRSAKSGEAMPVFSAALQNTTSHCRTRYLGIPTSVAECFQVCFIAFLTT